MPGPGNPESSSRKTAVILAPRHETAVAVFARLPRPGRTKTRLIPLLGGSGAAELQAALLADALRKLGQAPRAASRYVFLSGGRAIKGSSGRVFEQRGANLGARLEHAFRRLLARHRAAIVIGTDSPTLSPRTFGRALGQLRATDAVLGPCPDGGYYLIGLGRYERGLLDGIAWGTRFALRHTLRNLQARGFSWVLLEPLEDLDRPADLRRLAATLFRDPVARRRCPAVWQFVRARLAPPRPQGGKPRLKTRP